MDAGALVVTAEHEAAGIIVAGSAYRALLAPIWPFLAARKLTLGSGYQEDDAAFEERRAKVSWSPDIDELAREESYPLGDMPEAA